MNFLEIYKAYCEEITDAPPNFHDFVAIVVGGIALGNQCFIPFGDTRIFPNIWLLLLGDSSYSRKTTSINIGRRLLSEVCPEKIYPNEFSQERIQSLLETMPSGAFFFSEFITLMGLLNRDYMSGTKGFLADIYDSPFTYKRETQGRSIKICNPAISIISATTQSWFMERLKESDIQGGFLPRFIIIMPEKKTRTIAIPPEGDKAKRHELVKALNRFQKMSGVFSIHPDARREFEAWYKTLMDLPSNHRTDPFVNRLQVYTLKFAMILNVITEMNLIISHESMKRAIRMMYGVFKSLSHIDQDELVFGKPQTNMKKIVDCLMRHGSQSKSSLLVNTRLSTKEFNEAAETLKEMEKVSVSKIKTSRRPVEFYELAKKEDGQQV